MVLSLNGQDFDVYGRKILSEPAQCDCTSGHPIHRQQLKPVLSAGPKYPKDVTDTYELLMLVLVAKINLYILIQPLTRRTSLDISV